MKILGIDTSGLTATVGISDDENLVAQYSIQHKTTHSQILMPMADSIKNLIGLDLSGIDAIAISKGPGSFTGLRIGAATAKALCLALDKPLIAVPTIDAMAYGLYGTDKIVCPMMDARRNQVYTGVYSFAPIKSEDSKMLSYTMKIEKKQCACSIEEIADYLNSLGKEVALLGDGVPVYIDMLEKLLKVPFYIVPMQTNRQNAASLCALAYEYSKEDRYSDADSFAPEYLRKSQAERQAENGENAILKAPKVKEKIFIKPIKTDDFDAAAALEKENLGKEAWSLNALITAISRDDTIYLVASKNNKIIGLCGVQNISGDGEITNVSVDKNERQNGVAYKMLKQLLERGRGLGIKNYTLEVRKENTAARKLYEKLGFKEEGVRKNFYENPKDDAVIYWLRDNEGQND